MLLKKTNQQQGGITTQSYFYHLKVDYFPKTEHSGAFYSSYITETCQKWLILIKEQQFTLFYQCIITFNAIERPRNKLLPVIGYVIAAQQS